MTWIHIAFTGRYTFNNKNNKIDLNEIIITLEKESPEFKESYYQKYLDARKDAGIKDNKDTKNSFLRFMVEDAELPGLDLVPNEFFDLSDLE